MIVKGFVSAAGFALGCLAASAAYCGTAVPGLAAGAGAISAHKFAEIVPGRSTKAQVRSVLGTPWRIEQFNDCGMAMPGQANETWEYRGTGAHGSYRIHIEFDAKGVAHLVAKIPDETPGGKATAAKIAPAPPPKKMSM